MGYGSINHPIDRDPVCGYTGIIGDVCPRCGERDGEGIDEKVLRKIKGLTLEKCNVVMTMFWKKTIKFFIN